MFAACVTIPAPIEEYAVARAAFEAARMVDAPRFSAGYYYRAVDAYSRAEIAYNNREFHEARDLFVEARLNFERAENSAQVQRKKNGDPL